MTPALAHVVNLIPNELRKLIDMGTVCGCCVRREIGDYLVGQLMGH